MCEFLKVLISSEYDYTISETLHRTLASMQKSNKRPSAILRTLLNGIILDAEVFAESNAEVLLKNYPIIDKACKGIYFGSSFDYINIKFTKLFYI